MLLPLEPSPFNPYKGRYGVYTETRTANSGSEGDPWQHHFAAPLLLLPFTLDILCLCWQFS